MKKFLAILAVMSLILISCGEKKENNKTDDDSAVNDESNDNDVSDEVLTEPDESTDETVDEITDETIDEIADETSDEDSVNPMGFDVRKPSERTVSCEDNEGTNEELTLLDKDWVCTFNYDGKSGFVYIQSNMTSCEVIYGANPVFTTVGSWISFDGVVSEITGANYDWGGNHHNDFLDFTYSGEYFKIYHSSFGYGWRSCQNMDCMQVGDPVTEDGCTKERTLPSVCQEVSEDGKTGDFTDSFEPCAGDPNYEG